MHVVHGFQVILGGGRQEFLPKMMNGNREDGRDLIAEWKVRKINNRERHVYVRNKTELMNVNLKDTDKLLGDNIQYNYYLMGTHIVDNIFGCRFGAIRSD